MSALIVVGVDHSVSARAAANCAAAVAARCGATLRLVHARYHPVSYDFTLSTDPPAERAAEAASARLLDRMAAALRKAHPGLAVTPVAVLGAAAPHLAHESAEADLLVLGHSTDDTGAGPLIADVVATAGCPVLIVPTRLSGLPWTAPVVAWLADEPDEATAALSGARWAGRCLGQQVTTAGSDGDRAALAAASAAILCVGVHRRHWLPGHLGGPAGRQLRHPHMPSLLLLVPTDAELPTPPASQEKP